MSITILVVAMIAYLFLLFWMANFGDKQQFSNVRWPQHPLIYSLALGVYCTSWTFFGLVGTAANKGWAFLPILLGPLLLFLFGQPLLKRVAALCHQENIRSIADFMASRYGKRRGIATSVTLIVFFATVPYIALQIKAVTDAFLMIANTPHFSAEEMALVTSVAMIVFAFLFGIKRLDGSGYHTGLMSVIAFESIVKLMALIVVAIFALFILFSEFPSVKISAVTADFGQMRFSVRFCVETAISAAAILCLPRMFHVVFVENQSKGHLQVARYIFPTYLVLFSICIVIIAGVGNINFTNESTTGVVADSYVLALPMHYQNHWITLLGFIGGFSAATAMIIVATVTLSHMLSNDVVLPFFIHKTQRKQQGHRQLDYFRGLLLARRMTVVVVVGFAYIYQRVLAGNAALTDIGLIAFALVVQLFPSLIFGIYSKKGHAISAYAGLTIGCATWFVTLMLPLLAESGAIPAYVIAQGLLGVSWLRPEYLFGLEFADSYTRGVIISLSANAAAYWLFSKLGKAQLSDKIQAKAFADQNRNHSSFEAVSSQLSLTDLTVLLTQFLGESATTKILSQYQESANTNTVPAELLDAAEHALAGVVGVASSRALLSSLTSGLRLAVEDVVNMFEETAKALRFNQDLIVASFESISSAISVVNADMKLVMWNRRYEEMFDYPKGMLKIGMPVEELVRFNSSRGLLGPGSADEHVKKRLTNLMAGKPYRVVRSHGRSVIEIKGSPLPGGGYVTTYDDISEFIDTQERLESSNLYLEQRVKERTAELEIAQQTAEEANRSKSRFLALASHDILQPLNAASLYTGVLLEGTENETSETYKTVVNLRAAIQSTEGIISTLMEIARLDTGVLQTAPKNIALNSVLAPLINEFRLKLNSSVELRYVPTRLNIKTDPRYIRRIMQNFLSNAVKFTKQGKILIGCRRRGGDVEIWVCDTGPGIHPEEKEQIFNDFFRSSSQQGVEGLGLGLAVAARFSRLLEHGITCHSELGMGSQFCVTVPLADGPVESESEPAYRRSIGDTILSGKTIVYVDDDAENISAMESLLKRWGCALIGLNSCAEALAYASSNSQHPDLLIVDLHLDQGQDGLAAADSLHETWGQGIPTCIVSAAPDQSVTAKVIERNYQFLRKPLKPGKLRSTLEQMISKANNRQV